MSLKFPNIGTFVSMSEKDLLGAIEHWLGDVTGSVINKNDGTLIISRGVFHECVIINNNMSAIHELGSFFECHYGNFIMGYFSYDLKNAIETSLFSKNEDFLDFPDAYFYVPQTVVSYQNGKFELLQGNTMALDELKSDIKASRKLKKNKPLLLKNKVEQKEYEKQFNTIKEHLRRGDIYEVNYCIPFIGEGEMISPISIYERLNFHTQAPFSVYHQHNDLFLLSGSPERFFKKEGSKIITQPIKGTRKRALDSEIDEQRVKDLQNDPKERSENIMIVDLVRNDLSRIAAKGSVRVDELLKVYSFKTVHQLISTVSCSLRPEVGWQEILKALFPMGSMTGAPKIRAMEIIEKVECFKRGLYSGSFGYINPNGDADFNVIIRSIMYNKTKKKVLAPVGGAITIQANAKDEYEECLIKVNAMQNALSG